MKSKRNIIIGSRGSKLALAQSQNVLERLAKLFPKIVFEIKIIKTKGDKILDAALSRIGGKGLFTKELEDALLKGEIDLAVHSIKDLPTELPEGLKIGAVTKREDARDVLVLRGKDQGETGLKPVCTVVKVKKIGTSSLRRGAQLLARWPDLQIEDLRGNLDTRLRKLKEENLDAVVVAYAGIKRLKVSGLRLKVLPISRMLPAPGQGALGIEIRSQDQNISKIILQLNHPSTRLEVTAERSLLKDLGGGCQVPIGAFAKFKQNRLELSAIVASLDGRKVIRGKLKKKISLKNGEVGAASLGKELAKKLRAKGADQILKSIKR